MAELTTDQSGDLGELLARLHLSRPVGGRYRRALFQPIPLGAKYPTVDLIVDVLDSDGEPVGFFFAQVKATQSTSRVGGRLPLTVDMERYRRLTRLRGPAYLIGVDLADERSYVTAATPPAPAALPSMPRDYPLTDDQGGALPGSGLFLGEATAAPELGVSQCLAEPKRAPSEASRGTSRGAAS